ncbi:putative transcription factor interactor and regulator AUX-IAA family [Helianthus annuus]|uniref:Auxin-responsive protein n=1 Tax=Helianthus annuus TaxID=4232 RepID=A0A251TP46_HELAN|nr:auxin-responsive protein IAA33 [Helianthus annuus]KAF5787572.1 putative transcription factor interactor and regulator AUX-IAA family [Helianthus annuus]KAJ0884842.1 putative transcription factor interactor and regulator AUX-IAA family [Helianthus annuus]
MNTNDQQGSLNMMKRRWLQDHQRRLMQQPYINMQLPSQNNNNNMIHKFLKEEDDLIAGVIPAVTVVVEGRSICHRISLHNHDGYNSLAKALRHMLVDDQEEEQAAGGGGLDLSNAVPGHIIAYEDMENDLLLAGDLNWKDFTRVARRIRIIPVKGNSSKGKGLK